MEVGSSGGEEVPEPMVLQDYTLCRGVHCLELTTIHPKPFTGENLNFRKTTRMCKSDRVYTQFIPSFCTKFRRKNFTNVGQHHEIHERFHPSFWPYVVCVCVCVSRNY